MLAYAGKVLGVEMLATLRAHGDKLVIGAVLGPAALGLYAFAANIGKGLTLSLSQGLSAVVLPHLRRGRENGVLRRSHAQTVAVMFLAVAPLALLQAACADWLIPILFGAKWQPAAGLVAVLALGSMAHPLIAATSQMLRADVRTGEDLAIGIIVTAGFFTSLLVSLPFGLWTAVVCTALTQFVIAVLVTVYGFASLRTKGWCAREQPA